MDLDNIDGNNDISKVANESLEKYNKIIQYVNELSVIDRLINNIKDMKNRFDKLVMNKVINKNDPEYKMLEGKINQAIILLEGSSDLDRDTILEFMDICSNFREMYYYIKGGE